jgi:hypothetical protein
MDGGFNARRASQQRHLSDAEVWAAIRYLERAPRRSASDIIVFMALAWAILLACSIYLAFVVKR